MEKIRRPKVLLLFDGKDITRDITPYLVELTYTDFAHGRADNIEIQLEDRDGIWKFGWFPEKGSKLEPFIEFDQVRVRLGKFEIDEIEVSSPPDVIIMRGVSSFITKDFRFQKKNRTFESMSLKMIAQKIAQANGFRLYFEGEDQQFDQVSQKEESDLSFLKRLCDESGKNIKVCEEKIVIFDAKTFDAKEPVKTYARGEADIISFRFRTKSADIYKGACVVYFDQRKKELVSYVYTLPYVRYGHILRVNKKAESRAVAEKIAKSELRKKNKFEATGTLEIVGDPKIFAGTNICLSGFGYFDGNWFVEQATHKIAGGYTLCLEIRKVLCY